MKMIGLLNLIARGEEVPKKIKYANTIYIARYYEDGKLFEYVDITNDEEHFSYYCVPLRLNDEVEIIEEEKEIEHLPFNNVMKEFIDVYHELEKYNYKINELIGEINKLKRDKE